MLSVLDVLSMKARGKPLPQERLPSASGREVEILQKVEPDLVNSLLGEGADDPAGLLERRLTELTDRHHWFIVAAVLCMSFAHRYQPDTLSSVSGISRETRDLLQMFSISAKRSSEEGVWTIPLAILADMGEEGALGFTACAGLCAAVGFARSSREAES